uniref:leucine-rich repeat domain-containing protein n=1 Tax=Prevotella sp. TaxID=59823 RepID=UPI003FF072ED
MRTFTFKSLFLTVLFVLLGSLAIQAADDGLITRQITLKLDEAGTLPNKISYDQKNLITNLKIVGEVNGTDWNYIREMAGRDFKGEKTDGKLSILDLSEAKIVAGGDAYARFSENYYTSNDKLGDYAFYGCSGLTSLTIPSSVTSIGTAAFYGCWKLTSLTIPSCVTSIGYSAFRGCSGLTNLTIPSGVTRIDSEAFRGCSGLTSIYIYPENLPELGIDIFTGCDAKNCTVYVPKGTYDAYKSSEFGYFEKIVEFDASGIDKVTTSTNAKEVSRYSVNGQRLSAPAKGLNIVKYSDGSVKKVVVQ